MDQEYESKAGLLAVADGLAETAGDTGLKRRLSSDGYACVCFGSFGAYFVWELGLLERKAVTNVAWCRLTPSCRLDCAHELCLMYG